jgi:P27 family predicted phage terminase small subunit
LLRLLKEIPGLISKIDRDAMASYCDAWQRYHDARDAMDSVVIHGAHGPSVHPSIRIMKDAQAEIKHWCREFGMTPSARAALPRSPPAEEINPIEAIARRGRA